MIGQFPIPYQDESLYSVIARAQTRLRTPSETGFLMSLFGTDQLRPTLELPGRLNALLANLPHGHPLTVERIINQHTIFPWIGPFLPPERARLLKQRMYETDGRSFGTMTGIMPSRVKQNLYFQFCPLCDSEDLQRLGEVYWHRLFQVPGVLVCPTHNVFLESHSVSRPEGASDHSYAVATPQTPVCVHSLCLSNCNHQALLWVAKSTQWLLEHPQSSPGLDRLRWAYFARLADRGYTNRSGRLRRALFRETFHVQYSDTLARLQSEFSVSGQDDWLDRLLRKPRRSASPLRHLLLVLFLGWSVEELFQTAGSYRSTSQETGQWPCRNPICPEFGKSVITTVKHQQTRAPIVACPTCGFQYRETLGSNRFHVIDYGDLWRSHLRQRWGDYRLSVRSITREFQVDSLTLKRHAAAENLPFPRPSVRPTLSRPNPLGYRKHIRGEDLHRMWEEALEKHKGLSASQVRKACPSLYARLYRADRAWLLAHQPMCCRRSAVQNRVDWEARDAQFCARVPVAVQSILNQTNPMRRVTVTAVLSLLRAAWISRHQSQFPRTLSAIGKAGEDRVAFALRRIRLAARCVTGTVTISKLQRKAGLRSEMLQHRIIRAELDRQIQRPAFLTIAETKELVYGTR